MKRLAGVILVTSLIWPSVGLCQDEDSQIYTENEEDEVDRLDPPLTDREREEYDRCRPTLLHTEVKEFLRWPPKERLEWLKRNCDDDYVFSKCTPDLSDMMEENYLAQPETQRRNWLRLNCAKILSPHRKNGVPPKVTVVRPPPSYPPRADGDFGWPASRIIAHSTFWQGFALIIGGVATVAGMGEYRDDFKALWISDFAVGGTFFFIGVISGATYLSDKSKKTKTISHASIGASESGNGFTLAYSRAF